MSRPGRPKAEAELEACPYRALVAAIVARAVDDARGQCDPRCAQPRAKLAQEARVWLADAAAVAELLELGGFESAPVLARLRQTVGEATGR
jgi:hypothetical protein